jgi:hypothetical protein
MNAAKTGVFLTVERAIAHGPFAEDPDEIAERIDEVKNYLNPEGPAQRRVAEHLGRLFVRRERLAKVEAAAYTADAMLTPSEEAEFGPEAVEAAQHGYHRALNTLRVVAGGEPDEALGVRAAAHHIRDIVALPRALIEGRWDLEVEPDNDDEWRGVIDILLGHAAETDPVDILALLNHEVQTLEEQLSAIEGRHAARTAGRMLAHTMDLVTRYDARIGREIERTIAQYKALGKIKRRVGP